MFYGIVLNRKLSMLRKFHPLFHLIGWGAPLVFGGAALLTHSIGYGPPLAWCFVQFKGFGMGEEYGLSPDYYLFYIPIGVLLLTILVLFWVTVIKLIWVRRASSVAASGKRRKSLSFRAQIRGLIFIFVVFVITFTLFQWRLQIEADNRKDDLVEVGLKWTYCKMKTFLNLPDPGYCPGDTNPARINYAHTVFESVLLSGIGMVIFIGFGADIGIYVHWHKIAKLARAREWRKAFDLVAHGRDPFKVITERKSKAASNNFGEKGKQMDDLNLDQQKDDDADNSEEMQAKPKKKLDVYVL